MTGRWIWHMGYILQFWWHAAVLLSIFDQYYSSADPNSWMSLVLRTASRAGVHKLPHGDGVIRWAINMSMCSLPWNPRFKQTIRGFTTHIIGFKEWYMYQILTLLIRFACLSISLHSRSTSLPATTMLGAQLVLCLLMIYVSDISEDRKLYFANLSIDPPDSSEINTDRHNALVSARIQTKYTTKGR